MNRVFSWLIDEFKNGIVDVNLFDDLDLYYYNFYDYFRLNFNSEIATYRKIGVVLLQYVWHNIFVVKCIVEKYLKNRFYVEYNRKRITSINYFYRWNIETSWGYINLFDYVLGVKSDVCDDEHKRVIHILDSFDVKINLNVLLLKHISRDFNICSDIVYLILNRYYQII